MQYGNTSIACIRWYRSQLRRKGEAIPTNSALKRTRVDMTIANSRNKAYISLMTMLAFDTYRFVKDITAAGMKTEQAEVLASSYAHLVNDQLATKDDLKALEQRLDLKIDGKIDTLEQRLNARIAYAQLATIVILSAVMTLLAFYAP